MQSHASSNQGKNQSILKLLLAFFNTTNVSSSFIEYNILRWLTLFWKTKNWIIE